MQWQILLVASYVFYAFASPVYLCFLVFTTVVTYGGSIVIDNVYQRQNHFLTENKIKLSKEEIKLHKEKTHRKQKKIITLVVVILLLMLAIL